MSVFKVRNCDNAILINWFTESTYVLSSRFDSFFKSPSTSIFFSACSNFFPWTLELGAIARISNTRLDILWSQLGSTAVFHEKFLCPAGTTKLRISLQSFWVTKSRRTFIKSATETLGSAIRRGLDALSTRDDLPIAASSPTKVSKFDMCVCENYHKSSSDPHKTLNQNSRGKSRTYEGEAQDPINQMCVRPQCLKTILEDSLVPTVTGHAFTKNFSSGCPFPQRNHVKSYNHIYQISDGLKNFP